MTWLQFCKGFLIAVTVIGLASAVAIGIMCICAGRKPQ